jgi:adenosine kinase
MTPHLKIAVLGPIPRDHITTYQGKILERHGGILHPTVALAVLLGNQATIYPVAHVREIDLPPILEILSKYPNINTSYITANDDRGDIIRLRFIDENNRLEKQSGAMNPIVPDDVKNILDCDAYVCVPVTDFEIALTTLKFIKKYSKGLVLFDAHGPTTVMTALGDRLYKFWVDRDQWLPYIDFLKMNMLEAKCTWFRKKYTLSELENDYQIDKSELPDFARHCFTLGVKALYITQDERGCLGYFKKNGELQEVMIPAFKMDHVVNTTGCGDSFAGGLLYGYLRTKDFVKAAYYANAAGAQRTQGNTYDVFKPLTETEKMIKDFYGDL